MVGGSCLRCRYPATEAEWRNHTSCISEGSAIRLRPD
ncbi:MAG: hypothetical protein EWV52_12500 [Microcystis panniformis Mp_MB_F_20051200_S6D]|nr:MAG: hypothetical protein EWV43_19610 [Microcystis panniformis Mp_MB_F_20080800_S26D]TRV47270.1 MAG: hypothetical protein EWV87_14510 [Microcystis panniformis Mp_GB_SS_20050300_S99]TRV47960.1 MAG: hypothetical protein EWV42_15520 [Microcystis panniformis Mp_GB_SS_20050300_S99D]TRV62192.1 MAG: hypothetical protein EWV86_13890 [Microcystis panniformis Mp_MB_F_20051200_S9D]TRV62902.1 MAG: hypothetical protein EWV69_04715 [Microcystis panniformis Mp_MB_F_20080800_S26]TRV71899.1 MAG: hypothetica